MRKKREELVQAAEERLEQVRSESKQAEETLQMMQVNGERVRQEVEESRRRQVELVQQAVIELIYVLPKHTGVNHFLRLW